MESPEQSALKYQYYKEYPAQYRSARSREIGCAIVTSIPFLAVTIFGVAIYAVIWFHEGLTVAASLRLLGLFVVGSLFSQMLRNSIGDALRPRIVPCFQQRLGDIDTFMSGQVIAKRCQTLDELAIRLGVAPLSAFGFGDGFWGGEPTWHPAENGLVTVVRLLQYVRESDEVLFPTKEQLIRELVAIEDALRKAASREIMFCLHLKTETGTSLLIEEKQGGSCF